MSSFSSMLLVHIHLFFSISLSYIGGVFNFIVTHARHLDFT